MCVVEPIWRPARTRHRTVRPFRTLTVDHRKADTQPQTPLPPKAVRYVGWVGRSAPADRAVEPSASGDNAGRRREVGDAPSPQSVFVAGFHHQLRPSSRNSGALPRRHSRAPDHQPLQPAEDGAAGTQAHHLPPTSSADFSTAALMPPTPKFPARTTTPTAPHNATPSRSKTQHAAFCRQVTQPNRLRCVRAWKSSPGRTAACPAGLRLIAFLLTQRTGSAVRSAVDFLGCRRSTGLR